MIKPATYCWLQLWILMIFIQYSYIQYSFDKWQLHVCTVPLQVVYGRSGTKGLQPAKVMTFSLLSCPVIFECVFQNSWNTWRG